MNKKILILSIIVVLALLVWIFYNPLNTTSLDDNSSDDAFNGLITPVVTIDIDKYNQTITILSIENGTDLLWSDVELVNGTATLPTGSIDEGDIITECIGILDFKWKPTNEVFLRCEFLRGDE